MVIASSKVSLEQKERDCLQVLVASNQKRCSKKISPFQIWNESFHKRTRWHIIALIWFTFKWLLPSRFHSSSNLHEWGGNENKLRPAIRMLLDAMGTTAWLSSVDIDWRHPFWIGSFPRHFASSRVLHLNAWICRFSSFEISGFRANVRHIWRWLCLHVLQFFRIDEARKSVEKEIRSSVREIVRSFKAVTYRVMIDTWSEMCLSFFLRFESSKKLHKFIKK